MSNGVFGGYNKPNFEVKNLTSDMWSPITTNNNFSAYTPDKPASAPKSAQSVGTRPTAQTKIKSRPATENSHKPLSNKPKENGRVQKEKKLSAPKKKSAVKAKEPKKQTSPTKTDRPISSGRVPQKKPFKIKPPSKRMLNLAEKRRDKANKDFVRLINRGKTADEARIIINRKKIRMNRIKTLSSVAVLFVFALTFLLSYSYFKGAEISKIKINGNDVYTDVEVLEAGNLGIGMNMLTIREKQLNDKVTTILPFISEIGVDYKLPDVLELNVVPTKEQLILKCARKYICVDSMGKVVSDKKKKLAEGQFLVQGLVEQEYTVGENFKASKENAERFKIALAFAKAAEKSDTLNYGVLDLKDLKDITFTYRSKIRLYLGDGDNLEKKMERAIGIMNESDIGEKTGYINLKYDIGAYFMEGSMQ